MVSSMVRKERSLPRKCSRRPFLEQPYSHPSEEAKQCIDASVICLLQFVGGRLADVFNPLSKSISTLLHLDSHSRQD